MDRVGGRGRGFEWAGEGHGTGTHILSVIAKKVPVHARSTKFQRNHQNR